MITPTKTVCYVRMLDGSWKTIPEYIRTALIWGYPPFRKSTRIIVREELL